MQDKLENMKKFFKYDLEIKNILYDAMPKEIDKYNNDYIIEYSDKLFKAINDIEFYINVILDKFNYNNEDKEYFNNFIKALKSELIKCGYDFNSLINFYKVCFANMTEELVNKVGENCVGYYLFKKNISLSNAKSLNEILHIIHQTIVNNENNLNSLPILQEKQNKEGYPISLYGYETELSNMIFNNFPLEISCGYTDIVSLDENNIIMMIRDRGHALSIEIIKEKNNYYVKYFIPKICNIDKVNELDGVRKVTKDSKFTTGIFKTNINDLSFKLNEFISKVPTDSDMFKKGGIFYQEEVKQK